MKWLSWIAIVLLAAGGAPSRAVALDRPTGHVILTVTGAISRVNDGDRAIFDRAMLERLGKASFRTSTAWTDGVVEFEGVPVKALLDAVGIRGTRLRAVAINDYAIDLDATEFDTVPALLALKMNGAELRVRDKGPIWIVYPRDDHPEIRTDANNYKWIWQLKSISVR